MKSLLILLAACDMGVPEQPTPPDPIVTVDGHHYAVVRREGLRQECSNLGGVHLTLSVDGLPPERLLHAGGHGVNMTRRERRVYLSSQTDVSAELPLTRYFVAEIELADHPVAVGLDLGWCLSNMPVYYGSADRLVSASSLEDARAKLAAIPRAGYPHGEVPMPAW